jgi:hypothetical protein
VASGANVNELISAGVLEPLIKAVNSGGDQLAFLAIYIIGRIMDYANGLDAAVEAGAIEPLLKAVKFRSHGIGKVAADVLIKICGRSDGVDEAIVGIMRFLVGMCTNHGFYNESSADSCAKYLLSNLTSRESGLDALMSAGIIKLLFEFAGSGEAVDGTKAVLGIIMKSKAGIDAVTKAITPIIGEIVNGHIHGFMSLFPVVVNSNPNIYAVIHHCRASWSS